MSRFSRLIRDRVTEKDVRDHLSRQGFRGRKAEFERIVLHAMARPGWVQIFKFRVVAPDQQGAPHRFHGVLRDDDRVGIRIHLAGSEEEQTRVADEWSEGLITTGRQPLSTAQWVLLAVFGASATLALVGALLSAT